MDLVVRWCGWSSDRLHSEVKPNKMQEPFHSKEAKIQWRLRTSDLKRPVFSSARSRVRGTLEVYHAYIRDLDASDTSSTNNEQEWDILNASEASIEADTATQNNVRSVQRQQPIIFHFRFMNKLTILVFYSDCIWFQRNRTASKWLGGAPGCKRKNILCQSQCTFNAMGKTFKVSLNIDLFFCPCTIKSWLFRNIRRLNFRFRCLI